MRDNDPQSKDQRSGLERRELLAYSAAFGTTFLAAQGLVSRSEANDAQPSTPYRSHAPKRYSMKKSINLWAFPYPDTWSLKHCLELAKDAGFEGVELNFALEGEFSAESPDEEIVEIGRLAKRVGIEISGI